MIRKNNFRGKRVSDNNWVYGSLAYDYDAFIRDNTNKVDDLHRGWVKVADDTVGQCIGREDDNGQPIYENDTIRGKRFNGTEFVGVVVFSNSSFVVQNNGLTVPVCEFGELEKIGNIYDNPELMK